MLEDCSFCKEKKFYPMRYHAKGQQTMATMIMNLFGTQLVSIRLCATERAWAADRRFVQDNGANG